MLQNAYFRAKIGADTAENEQHFAEIADEGRVGGQTERVEHLAVEGSGQAPDLGCK